MLATPPCPASPDPLAMKRVACVADEDQPDNLPIGAGEGEDESLLSMGEPGIVEVAFT